MKFEHEFTILFLYHKCDQLTRNHLDSLRMSNPAVVVVPVTDTVPELLPGSVDVGKFPDPWASAQKWRSIDSTLYRWFANRTFNSRRYLVVEYDCFCNVNLVAYYAAVMSADVAGIDLFKRAENPRWKWFMESEIGKLPSADRPYAAGIVPFTCTMFSHEALEGIVANVCRNDVFCELRLGTVVSKLGLNFARLSIPNRESICWHIYPWRTDRQGLFHSIKSLDHNRGRRKQPGAWASTIHDFLRSLTCDRELLPFHLDGRRKGVKRQLQRLTFGPKKT